jgi:hypothetical protein
MTITSNLDADRTIDAHAAPESTFLATARRIRRSHRPPAARRSFPLRAEFAQLLHDMYGWTIEEAKALSRVPNGLPLKVTGAGCGRRYIFVVALADQWLLSATGSTGKTHGSEASNITRIGDARNQRPGARGRRRG